ncbi:hypothetical protein K7X08_030227 [Anisodus acutangulus]|uniref:Metallo-beta-lactamase domain-containing protein n=1 Tax=Anisodus acutangulus TaxID=402998 RepID=A0A9Q1R367_9SOLA|nr:hypothetical protein K7X08_030227 [Anisodus acutangulus]
MKNIMHASFFIAFFNHKFISGVLIQILKRNKPFIPLLFGSEYISPCAVKSSSTGFLSAIERAIEEEEYRKARAEVNRKGLNVEGYSIEGHSIGGHETCVIVPQLKAAFDIGRCPSRAVHQNFLFITHAHLDHIGGLPMYIATRGLYGLKPPTVFVPPSIKEDVEKLLDIHSTMSNVELNLDLIALDVGETYEMRNDLVVRPVRTHHVIPSQGYVIYSVRKKLKKQYIHLEGKKIEKLKKSGVQITDSVLCPEVAFTGDTASDFYLDPRSADALRAKVLITEATFLDDNCSVEHAREHGHTHIYEIMEHAKWIRNKTLVLTHFSPRYSIEEIRQGISKLKPQEEMEEAAYGLELSNVHFIWVVRFPTGEEQVVNKLEETLPQGFLRERGRIVEGRAPQARILKHPTIGAFLTHCGWNSILESIEFGVPIIALPMNFYSDQPMNARLIVENGVAVEIARDGNGKLHRGNIAEIIKDVIFGEQIGEDLRRKVKSLGENIRLLRDRDE